ncbi:MAG: ComEC/Rec2 family competence protein [Clostridia bacterium]|nr:ComEC/Rec2 family competence protein [Clostridia bacterium]
MEESLQEIEQAEDKLFNFRPIFFFAVCICLGATFAVSRLQYGVSFWWLTIVLPVFLLAIVLQGKGKRLRALTAVLTLALAFTLGCCATFLKLADYQTTKTYQGEYTVSGRVVESARGDYHCAVLLRDVKIGGQSLKGKLVAYLPPAFYDNIRLSDEVEMRGELDTDVSLFNEHGFRANAIYDDLRYRLVIETSADCIIKGNAFDLFLSVRQRIADTLRSGMDETTAAVTLAVLTGDTSLMGEKLLANMRFGGIAHVFAVSGLHVGALYAFCLLLLSKTPLRKMPKAAKWCLVAAVLLFYGGMCGYSASVVRATVMCLAFYFGKLTGFLSDGLENVGLSASILLLLSPVALFTVGFQLSYAATLGILLLHRPIYERISQAGVKLFCLIKRKSVAEYKAEREDRPPTLAEDCARSCATFFSVTVSAQIATTPLALSIFGYVSVWSLLLNCTFVPIISAAFSFLLLLVALACLMPLTVSGVLLYVPSVVWSAALLIFQTLDFSQGLIESVVVSGEAMICYYAACLFLTDKWNASKRYKIAMFTAFAVLFAIVFALSNL